MDIYFKKEYGKLYEQQETGELRIFEHECPYGKVRNMFIKRKIPMRIDGETFYDITTPYGYGGPIIEESYDTEKLMQDYFKAFQDYCKQEHIVSEFVRFHFFENTNVRKYFDGEVSFIGPHIIRDLKEPLEENMSKTVRRDVRRAPKQGLEIKFDTTGDYLEEFLTVYYSTMDRNDAKDFYYFDRTFFEEMHQSLKGHFVYLHVLLDGKVICTGLVLYGERYGYGLLGGTLQDYFSYNPNTYLEIQTMKWLKEKGLDYYIMGGGYNGQDGVYKYKKKFAQNGDYPFYIGKKIYNPRVYDKLTHIRCQENNFNPDTSFFPAYRA